MDLYDAITELRTAAKVYADSLEGDQESSSFEIDKIDDALIVSERFLKVLRGAS